MNTQPWKMIELKPLIRKQITHHSMPAEESDKQIKLTKNMKMQHHRDMVKEILTSYHQWDKEKQLEYRTTTNIHLAEKTMWNKEISKHNNSKKIVIIMI